MSVTEPARIDQGRRPLGLRLPRQRARMRSTRRGVLAGSHVDELWHRAATMHQFATLLHGAGRGLAEGAAPRRTAARWPRPRRPRRRRGPARSDGAVRTRATAGGAVVELEVDDVVVMRSPGGFPFCLTSWEAYGSPAGQVRRAPACSTRCASTSRARPARPRGGLLGALTGWEVRGPATSEFSRWPARPTYPCGCCCSDSTTRPARCAGHLDFASEDRDTEVAALVAWAPRSGRGTTTGRCCTTRSAASSA